MKRLIITFLLSLTALAQPKLQSPYLRTSVVKKIGTLDDPDIHSNVYIASDSGNFYGLCQKQYQKFYFIA